MVAQGYVYTKFNKISYSRLKVFNIYGIIVEAFYKISYDRSGKAQDEYRLKINDGSQDEDINVTAYCELDKIPYDAFQRGRIVRFHRLTKNLFKNKKDEFYLCGRIGAPTSVLLFDIPLPGARVKFNPCYRSNVMYSQSTKDEKFLAELIAKATEVMQKSQLTQNVATNEAPTTIATPQRTATQIINTSQQQNFAASPLIFPQSSNNVTAADSVNSLRTHSTNSCALPTAQQQQQLLQPIAVSTVPRPLQQNHANRCASKTPAYLNFFKKMNELVYGNASYYNVLFQIVSCYTNGRGNAVLRVWDGTQNSEQVFVSPSSDIRLIYGDEKKEKLVAGQKKLYDVICYDDHGKVASNLKAGDYIALVNVHFFIPNNCWLPSLVMHSGPGKRGNSGAGRRIVKITKESPYNYFDVIDGLIKENEKCLSPVEENLVNKAVQPLETNPALRSSDVAEEDDLNDSFYDDSIFHTLEINNQATVASTTLQPTSIDAEITVAAQANVNADTTVAIPSNNDVGVPPTQTDSHILNIDVDDTVTAETIANSATPRIPSISQCSTITISSDGSTQSCIVLSQYSPERNYDIITLSSSQTIPPANLRFVSAAKKNPLPTVSNNPSSSAIRRPANIVFRENENPEFPAPKRFCVRDPSTSSSNNTQDDDSTQALFDKLQSLNSQSDDLDESSFYISEEQRMLDAITDTQLERMWEIVENAQLQPSLPIGQW